jgi:hypothetical protein
MVAVFNGGGGHKVFGHIGEGDGELRGRGTGGARESQRWIWRASAVALHAEAEGRRIGVGGMGPWHAVDGRWGGVRAMHGATGGGVGARSAANARA